MHAPHHPSTLRLPSEFELVFMMASIMALNALAIDTMLPGLPMIASSFGLTDPNKVQFVVASYLLGVGAGSLFYGPLSDRFGRRAILLPSILGYSIFSLACSFAPSFPILIGLRIAQGLCGAALGVLVIAIIRDRFEGDAMARRMSMIFMVFMIVPIIAPLVGSAILTIAPWRTIFDLFAVLGMVVAIWVWLRLPETLRPEFVQPIQPTILFKSWKQVSCHRMAMGYMLAGSMTQGALYGYLTASEQLFSVTFNARDFFPIGFAIIALGIACANFTNSRIVERYGARRVSQSAVFLFIFLGLLQLLASWLMPTSIPVFLILVTANMALIGFTGSNFSAIAMQPFAGIAGAASSYQQTVRTVIAAVLGGMIGQQFNGSVTPIALGFALCGVTALALIFWAERGRLFTRPGTTFQKPQ
jgi:MFS transporter, DHA1 family, multidrug resistance protein